MLHHGNIFKNTVIIGIYTHINIRYVYLYTNYIYPKNILYVCVYMCVMYKRWIALTTKLIIELDLKISYRYNVTLKHEK